MKRAFTSVITALILGLACSSCEGLKRIGANTHSYRQEKESVTLTIYDKKKVLYDQQTTGEKAVGVLAAEEALKLLVKGVSYVMKKEGERYTASYTGAASEKSLDLFGGFTLTRNAAHTKDPAMTAKFSVMPSEKGEKASAFKLKMDWVTLNDAKAKVPFNQDSVDMTVSVILQYITENREKGSISETFVIKGLKINSTTTGSEATTSGWIPIPKKVSGVPYDLHVSVTETNDFGKWFTKVSSEIDSNQDKLVKALQGQ